MSLYTLGSLIVIFMAPYVLADILFF